MPVIVYQQFTLELPVLLGQALAAFGATVRDYKIYHSGNNAVLNIAFGSPANQGRRPRRRKRTTREAPQGGAKPPVAKPLVERPSASEPPSVSSKPASQPAGKAPSQGSRSPGKPSRAVPVETKKGIASEPKKRKTVSSSSGDSQPVEMEAEPPSSPPVSPWTKVIRKFPPGTGNHVCKPTADGSKLPEPVTGSEELPYNLEGGSWGFTKRTDGKSVTGYTITTNVDGTYRQGVLTVTMGHDMIHDILKLLFGDTYERGFTKQFQDYFGSRLVKLSLV